MHIVTEVFQLDKNYIFMPDEGYESEEDKIYTRILIHPALMTSKSHFRLQINQYLVKLMACVEKCTQSLS